MTVFSENLTTPHVEIAQAGVASESLLESARFLTIAAAYEVSEKTYDDQVEAAYATAHLVRQSLRFDTYETRSDWVSADDVATDQRTNCHGYTIVTSECLEHVGIPHYPALANQHSFIVLQTPDGTHTNLIDTAVKQLYVDSDGAISEPPIASQIAERMTGANELDMNAVLSQSGFSNKEQALYTYPWMSFQKFSTSSRTYAIEKEQRHNRLMLRTYEPEQGRQILQAYANFMLAMRRSNFDTAHRQLQPLDGEYPDVDRRNHFREPTRLIRYLGTAGQLTRALSDIKIVENSLWATDDLVVHLWPADERRHLGVATGHPQLIGASINEYEAIIEERKRIGLTISPVPGRIEKAKKQWAAVRNQ
jgi:hypothetical protein